ncbi:hypothetical protein GCM10009597_50200 [Peribacillus frigoritolerans]
MLFAYQSVYSLVHKGQMKVHVEIKVRDLINSKSRFESIFLTLKG